MPFESMKNIKKMSTYENKLNNFKKLRKLFNKTII